MSAERRKVLEMLAADKITPEEAEQLLDRLASRAAQEEAPEGAATSAGDGEAAGAGDGGEDRGRPEALRFLRIVVDSPERDSVNIRLPLGLVRTGLKLSTLMPERVSRLK